MITVDGVPATLSGLRITGGRENAAAGIVATKRLRLTHGTIERNIATGAGGGIFVEEEATLQPHDAEIARNNPTDCAGSTAC